MTANETHIQDRAGQGSLHWLALSAAVIVADQATKLAADALLAPYQPVPVAPFANLTLVYNPGAAFSLFSDAGGWQRWLLLGLAVVVGAVLAAWLKQTPRNQPWTAAGIALVLGGAAGNAIDRLAYGYVIDFIDIYYQVWHWPAFNLADSAITIGILILLIEMFTQPRSPPGTT